MELNKNEKKKSVGDLRHPYDDISTNEFEHILIPSN